MAIASRRPQAFKGNTDRFWAWDKISIDKNKGKMDDDVFIHWCLIFIHWYFRESGTVFQTAALLLVIIPRLRPGLLSLRSVLPSRQVEQKNQWIKTIKIFLSIDILFFIYWSSNPQKIFTVLIAIQCAPQSQGGIYGLSQKSINFLHDGKYSSKGGEFLGFYLYFCHVIQSFICF